MDLSYSEQLLSVVFSTFWGQNFLSLDFEKNILATASQCGGLSLRCHRATVYRDIKIQWTSAKSYSCRLDSSKLIMTHQTMFSAILGHSKSFIFVSSHPKSTWVTKTPYVGGLSIQYQIYCDSVVTTTILLFGQLWQKLMLSSFLSSGNLCLIHHLKLFWPHGASTASVK